MNIKIMILIVSILYVSALAVGYFDKIEIHRLKSKRANDFLHQQIESLSNCEKEEPKTEGNKEAVKMYKGLLRNVYFDASRDEKFILDDESEEGIIKYLGKIPLEDKRRL
jgi:hypothetical protein